MKLFKIFTWCVALTVLCCTVYIVTVLSEVHKKLSIVDTDYSAKSLSSSVLEAGTYVLKEDLNQFLTFSEKKIQIDDEIVLQRNKYLINKEIELPKILHNDCERYNCIKFNINFDDISPLLWKGLIGIEDYRFLDHDGVDYKSILRALIADIKAMKKVQGGSTLTMQLAKNLFLTNEKRIERKVREMIYAFYIEYKLPKEKIMTTYFNEIFWGVVGGVYIKGIKAASIAYFDKKPHELDDFESSLLIGMLKGPYFYNPFRHLDRLKKRTNIVFKRLKELSLVRSGEDVKWDESKWDKWAKRLENKNNNNFLKSYYYLSKTLGDFLEPFEKFTFYQSVFKIKNQLTKQTKDLDIATKFLAMDITCETNPCPKSFYHYSKIERSLEAAIFKEKHQVGSVLKPIIYEQFIELGKNLNDEVSTKPITLNLLSGNWTPKDSSKVKKDYVDLRYAVKKSKNIPLIRTASEVGFDNLEPLLKNYFPELLSPLREYPAQLLGAIEMSMADLGKSYIKYFKKTCENIKNEKYKFEESILYEMSKADETTISRVSNSAIKDILMFGKTGTTNQGLDNWYVAFDGKVFYAIWFGVDSNRKDKKLRLAGATSAYRIFQNFQLYRGKQLYELYCNN